MAITSKIIQELQKRDGNKCSICGEQNAKLQVHHIEPISQGSKDSLENLRLICPSCHANIHRERELREFEFVNYVFQLMGRSEKFRNVRSDVEIRKTEFGEAAGLFQSQPDLVAEEEVDSEWQKIVVDCKAQSSFTLSRLASVLATIDSYRKYFARARFVFAFPGELSPASRSFFENQNIEIWDLSYLSNKFQLEIPHVEHPILQPMLMAIKPKRAKSPEERLIRKLKLCKPGRGDWAKYQKLIGSILERLFCPPLSTPLPELSDAPKVNRRDFILPNYAEDGFWAFLRSRYSADYIVTDAKNLSGKVGKREVLQISNYLKPHGAGLFGLIICRHAGNARCTHTLREIWAIDRKLIIVLTDHDIEQMLLARSYGAEPASIIRQKIEDFRLTL